MMTHARVVPAEEADGSARRWMIEGISGSPKVVCRAAEVRDLLDQGRINADSRVYEIVGEPRRLRHVPELCDAIPAPLLSEPATSPSSWTPERAELSGELAILDRPLEVDVGYFDERPPARSRGLKLTVLALVVAGLGIGAVAARTAGGLWSKRVLFLAGPPAAVAARLPAPAATPPLEAPSPPADVGPPTVAMAAAIDATPRAVPAAPDGVQAPKHDPHATRHGSAHRGRRHH